MDVKFTSSSGIQMPLANIVESSIDDDNGFIRFNNGIQIDYALATPWADTSDKPYLHGCIIYKKPFIKEKSFQEIIYFFRIFSN